MAQSDDSLVLYHRVINNTVGALRRLPPDTLGDDAYLVAGELQGQWRILFEHLRGALSATAVSSGKGKGSKRAREEDLPKAAPSYAPPPQLPWVSHAASQHDPIAVAFLEQAGRPVPSPAPAAAPDLSSEAPTPALRVVREVPALPSSRGAVSVALRSHRVVDEARTLRPVLPPPDAVIAGDVSGVLRSAATVKAAAVRVGCDEGCISAVRFRGV